MTFLKPVRRSINAIAWLALSASSASAAPTEVEYPPANRAATGTVEPAAPAAEPQLPLPQFPASGPELAGPRAAASPATRPSPDITPEGEPALAEPLGENSPPPAAERAPAELPEPISTRQSVFSIPFKVEPPRNPATKPIEIQLQVSGDEGQTWQLVSKVKPERGNFVFKAPHDGLYWFGIQTVDPQGKLHPATPLLPELRVIVDTLPPRLDLTATRGPAGEIVVEWQALDPGLKHDSLTIEYQSGAGEPWEPLAIDASAGHTQRNSLSGRATWWPKTAVGEVVARARVTDQAGNQSVKQVRVKVTDPPGIDHLTTRPAIEPPPLGDAAKERSGIRGPSAPANGTATNGTPGNVGPGNVAGRPAQNPSPNQQPPQPPTQFAPGDPFAHRGPLPPGAAQTNSNPSAPVQNSVAWPADRNSGPLSPDRVANGAGSLPNNGASAATGGVIDPDWRGSGTPRRPAGVAAQPVSTGRAGQPLAGRLDLTQLPPGERPSMVNARTFELEYEVDSVGPSGIAKVELWGTRDGGRTWSSYAVDSDNRSPIAVAVDGEGVYGFRIVVQSGTGLGGLPPREGDTPEIWAAVDLTQPVVKITAADVGRDLGDIVIRWQAGDDLLERRPISLFYSDRPQGPWTPIASGLDNTGSYSWRLDNRVPDRVYLHIEARDEAGNIGSYDTAEPLALDRQRPQGRIRGVHSK